MKLEKAEIGMKVLQPSTGDVGVITHLSMSKSGLNRVYADLELDNGDLVCRPLDLLLQFN
jgi:hypothetical protein